MEMTPEIVRQIIQEELTKIPVLQGPQGPAGPPGRDGVDGVDGMDGMQGLPGNCACVSKNTG